MNHYESSEPYCRITGLSLVEYTAGITFRNIRGYYAVIPNDISFHADYVFKFRIDTTPTGTVI